VDHADQIIDAQVRNQIALRRYIKRESRLLLKLFEQYDRKLALLLRERLVGNNVVNSPKFKALLADIVQLRKELMEEAAKQIKSTQKELTPVEHDREWGLLLAILGLNEEDEPFQATQAAINSLPFATGASSAGTLNQWLADLRKADYKRIRDALILGVSQGDSPDIIRERIIGTKEDGYRDGTVSRTRHNAQALIATTLLHLSQATRESIWVQTPRVVGLLWVAILDGKTSLICISRDNKVVMFGGRKAPEGMELLSPQGARPPAHLHCRSMMGVLIGTTPPNRLTFEQFFLNQTKRTQDDILGKPRAELFRSGKLPLDGFVNDTGHEYSITQLSKGLPT